MNRDLVINLLLILAGIVLAFALFGAGVLWKNRLGSEAEKNVIRMPPSSLLT